MVGGGGAGRRPVHRRRGDRREVQLEHRHDLPDGVRDRLRRRGLHGPPQKPVRADGAAAADPRGRGAAGRRGARRQARQQGSGDRPAADQQLPRDGHHHRRDRGARRDPVPGAAPPGTTTSTRRPRRPASNEPRPGAGRPGPRPRRPSVAGSRARRPPARLAAVRTGGRRAAVAGSTPGRGQQRPRRATWTGRAAIADRDPRRPRPARPRPPWRPASGRSPRDRDPRREPRRRDDDY